MDTFLCALDTIDPVAGVGFFRVGKLDMIAHSHSKGKLHEGHDNDVHSSNNVCSSAHNCG